MNRHRMLLVFICLLPYAAPAKSAEDSRWGDLRIRFVYDGQAAERGALELDPRVGIDAEVPDKSLIVHMENGGISNVVAYRYPPRGSKPANTHPSYLKNADARVKIEMTEGRFEPRVLLIRTIQTMVQVNDDEIAYAPHLSLFKNSPM